MSHTTEEDFQHFLTYSGLDPNSEMRALLFRAFEAGATTDSVGTTQEQIAASIQRKAEDALTPMDRRDEHG